MSQTSEILVLGGGISGLSAAWRLAKNGITVHVLESSPFLGGLAGTVHEERYALDFGPHSFFSEDPATSKLILELFPDGCPSIQRSVKFYHEGKYLCYPFSPKEMLWEMGLTNGIRALVSFLAAISRKLFSFKSPANCELNVEAWARSEFGNYLYETFFKPYTEQFWRIPASELSADSIPTHTRLGFIKTLTQLFGKASRKNLSMVEREKLPTFYPRKGYGEIAEKIADQCEALGVKIYRESCCTRIERTSSGYLIRYSHKNENRELFASRCISTLPIPGLIRAVTPTAPHEIIDATSRLDYRPFLQLSLVTKKQPILPASYLYTLNRPYNRLSESNYFSSQTSPAGENILNLEIPCLFDDVDWKASKDALYEKCLPSLERDGILKHADVLKTFLLKTRYAYPIYRTGYGKALQKVMTWVHTQEGLYSTGRLGAFRYGDIDQCIQWAFETADRVLTQLNANKPK